MEKMEDPKQPVVEIYTDGSHYGDKGVGKGERFVGFGGWCSYRGAEYEFSQECTLDLIKRFGLTEDDVKVISNPTAEFLALAFTLDTLTDVINRHQDSLHLKIYTDYEGVQKWPSRAWKAKKSYIQAILKFCDEWFENHPEVTVDLIWIRGHDGHHGNEEADRLAKSKEKHNTLKDICFA